MNHQPDHLSRRGSDAKPRSKRFLNAQDLTDIAARYEAGETTQQVGNRYGISKSRVTTILREQGIIIRRQGLNDEHISEAATLYAAGDQGKSPGVVGFRDPGLTVPDRCRVCRCRGWGGPSRSGQ